MLRAIMGTLSGCIGELAGDYRYSGARKGYRRHQGVLGAARMCRGVGSHYGDIRGCEECIGELAGTLGTQGPEGL